MRVPWSLEAVKREAAFAAPVVVVAGPPREGQIRLMKISRAS